MYLELSRTFKTEGKMNLLLKRKFPHTVVSIGTSICHHFTNIKSHKIHYYHHWKTTTLLYLTYVITFVHTTEHLLAVIKQERKNFFFTFNLIFVVTNSTRSNNGKFLKNMLFFAK